MRLLNQILHLFIFVIPIWGYSQYFDAGIFYGVSNYQGDLTTSKFEPSEFNLAAGAFIRYHFTPKVAIKTHFYGGSLTGSDMFSYRRARNLHFKSTILELGIQGEYSLFDYAILDKNHVASPHFFVGLSAFYFNPHADYNGTSVELRLVGTEGQGMPGYAEPYSRLQISIPMGLGFKVAINEMTNIGAELGFRKTFTDYIDDVSGHYPDMVELYEFMGPAAYTLSYRSPEYDATMSQRDPSGLKRGNSLHKDVYMFGGVTLSINFKKGKKFRGVLHKRSSKYRDTSYTQRYLF